MRGATLAGLLLLIASCDVPSDGQALCRHLERLVELVESPALSQADVSWSSQVATSGLSGSVDKEFAEVALSLELAAAMVAEGMPGRALDTSAAAVARTELLVAAEALPESCSMGLQP